jgi:hypothetical protein
LSADGGQVQEGAWLGAVQQRTKHDGYDRGPPEQGRTSRTREALVEAIGAAVSAVTTRDARGFFDQCGYGMFTRLSCSCEARRNRTVPSLASPETSRRAF